MKFLPYIIRNMLRHKLRNAFTVLSIAVSLFLVALLYAYISVQEELGEESNEYGRVMVMSTQGLFTPLPQAHLDDAQSVSGVDHVTPMSWFGGKYKDEPIVFSQFGMNPETVFDVFDEYAIAPEQLVAWQDDRQGCVVGRKLARNKGWKIGDKIVLAGDWYNVDLNLTLHGIFDGPEHGGHLLSLFFNWEYLEEALKQTGDPRLSGFVGLLAVKTPSAAAVPEVIQRIDQRFAGADPTQSMNEQAFQSFFTEMLGNVQGFIRNTALAVVFSLVCVAANAMAMSMRERTREVAVLRAIGFQRSNVLFLVLAEAMGVAMLGGLVGVLGAKILFEVYDISKLGMSEFAILFIPWSVVLLGMALAAVIGLASGIIPAWRAANISVVDGLRRVI